METDRAAFSRWPTLRGKSATLWRLVYLAALLALPLLASG